MAVLKVLTGDVCPGGKMDLAMQLIFTLMIWRLIEERGRALVRVPMA
ncbi:MAG: hypothetical protein ACR2I5_01700 [Candidatus Limnocylindria bacterium]